MLSVFWFRRDLRLDDNAGLYHALKNGRPVLPLFIFDTNILDTLPRKDARVEFIWHALSDLKNRLEQLGGAILIRTGDPEEVWPRLIREFPVKAVFTNRDFEPYAIQRDAAVAALLSKSGVEFHTFKDHVVFEKEEVVKDDGQPYTVFTPYKRKWLATLNAPLNPAGEDPPFFLRSYPNSRYFQHFFKTSPQPFPALNELGFEPAGISFPTPSVARGLVRAYAQNRDFPARQGTSRLGVHFRFGTVSIREKAAKALTLSEIFLSELIWRDFYSQILAHFPFVVDRPFKTAYERIPWRDAPEEFERWKRGQTGYPIVDAGMRELDATGYMHNRVRMIVASFLTKHLLIDWRFGEAWFAEKLLDFDLASNNGGWQWAAGCGTDAAPYFRIFNPAEQAKKFDPACEYIRKWVPEFDTARYPKPMVDHTFARARCLAAFRDALS